MRISIDTIPTEKGLETGIFLDRFQSLLRRYSIYGISYDTRIERRTDVVEEVEGWEGGGGSGGEITLDSL